LLIYNGSVEMEATAAPSTVSDIRRTARRGLAIYFAIVVVLSAAIEGFLIANPQLNGLIALLMFVPAVASVAARLILKEGFADVSFRFGGRRGLRAVGSRSSFRRRSVSSPTAPPG
jgi:hypothetical protein